jgi:hypothetical protein
MGKAGKHRDDPKIVKVIMTIKSAIQNAGR